MKTTTAPRIRYKWWVCGPELEVVKYNAKYRPGLPIGDPYKTQLEAIMAAQSMALERKKTALANVSRYEARLRELLAEQYAAQSEEAGT